MKNVDKIKGLEHELGRYRKKVAEQQREIAELKGSVEGAWKAAKSFGRMVDAICGACAVAYGKEEPEGTYSLVLPAPSVEGMGKNFDVHTVKDAETGLYVITAVQKPPEDG